MRAILLITAFVVTLAGCGPTLTDVERAWCDDPVNYAALVNAAARLDLIAGHAPEEQAAAYSGLPADEKVRVCDFAYEAAT